MGLEGKYYDEIYKNTVEKGDDKELVRNHNEIIRKFIFDWLPEGGNLLSVGCGALYEFGIFKEKNLSIYGIDISENAIRLAKRNRIEAKIGDAKLKIPFEDNFFDIVYAGEILEHLGLVGNFFKEINRVLKKQGILIITCPLLGYWKYRVKIFLGEDIFDDHHCRLFTINSIKKNMEENGLRLEDYRVAGKLKIIKKSLCGFGFFKGVKTGNI